MKISLFRNLKMDFSSTLGSNFSASSSFFHFFFVPNLLNVIQDWVCVCASECGKYPKTRRQMTRVAAHTLESQMYLYMVYGFVLQSFTFFLVWLMTNQWCQRAEPLFNSPKKTFNKIIYGHIKEWNEWWKIYKNDARRTSSSSSNPHFATATSSRQHHRNSFVLK